MTNENKPTFQLNAELKDDELTVDIKYENVDKFLLSEILLTILGNFTNDIPTLLNGLKFANDYLKSGK